MHSKKYMDRIRKMSARTFADESEDYITKPFETENNNDEYRIKLFHDPQKGYAYSTLVPKEEKPKQLVKTMRKR